MRPDISERGRRSTLAAVVWLLSVGVTLLSGCGGRSGSAAATPSHVASAFRRDGLPLKLWRTTTIANEHVVEFEIDPAVLGLKRVRDGLAITEMFLYVLVFDDSRSAAKALGDARERAAIRSWGMTVVRRENVVATILRGDATRGTVKDVTRAVDAATT